VIVKCTRNEKMGLTVSYAKEVQGVERG